MFQKLQGIFKKIMGNVQEDSGEYSRRFQLLFKKISENVWKESGECSDHTLGLIWYKIMGKKSNYKVIVLKETFSTWLLITFLLSFNYFSSSTFFLSLVSLFLVCLIAVTKFQSARGATCHPALRGNCWTCGYTFFPHPPSEWLVNSLVGVWDIRCCDQ